MLNDTARNYIMTGGGSWISWDMKHFLLDSRQQSSIIWPNKHPCHVDIFLWRKALHLISSDTYHIPFACCLGIWTVKPHLQWEWFLNPSTKSLFCLVEGGWQWFSLASAHLQWVYKYLVDMWDLDTTSLHLTTTHTDCGRLYLDGAATLIPNVPPTPTMIQEFIVQWTYGWPLHDSYFPTDPTHITVGYGGPYQ